MTPLRPQIVAAAPIPPAGRAAGGPIGLRGTRRQLVRSVVLSLSIFGLWLVAAPAHATAERRAIVPHLLEQGVLTEVNALRRQHGLVPLRRSSGLAAAARQHSTEMANRGYFDHRSADGSSFDRRIARFYPKAGYRYWAVGENLLYSTSSLDAARALDMWLNSPDHRRIILKARWREFGLGAVQVVSAPGVYSGRTVTIVTTDFGVRR
jgi:uncharacterized protein YkwD